jgi:hypothetical protein
MVELTEGSVMNGIMYRRIFKSNNSFIQVTVGQTGSGKSMKDIREVELWYKQVLKRPFPLENICFSSEQILTRLTSNELKKGDILVLEEAGVSQGSLDFASSVAKIFNYVLQSFRSMQIILFLNLPYFSMLNKNTRMLTHMLHETVEIDKHHKQCIVKPKFLKANQQSGKVYTHFPQVLINRSWESVERLGYHLPSEDIRVPYEQKKAQFLSGLVHGSLASLVNADRKRLTLFQMHILGCWNRGIFSTNKIAEEVGCIAQKVSENLNFMQRKGYLEAEYLEKWELKTFKPKNTAQPSNIQENPEGKNVRQQRDKR